MHYDVGDALELVTCFRVEVVYMMSRSLGGTFFFYFSLYLGVMWEFVDRGISI